jgi:cytochrome c oxidase assembly protein subunit 15
MADRAPTRLHRFATVTAVATYVLLFLGGLVTSTGSGLAVPDWPLSFGQVFPEMVGGVLYEHGHRLAASAVGLVTLVLAVWVVVAETRPGVRALGIAMLVVVILQGVLGGVTVLYKLPLAVSVSHACLAQIFFCLTVAMAIVTGPAWGPPRSPALSFGSPVAALGAATAVAVFGQLVLGALTRHLGAGLAIPDFPLAFGRLLPPLETTAIAVHFAHRCGALVVAVLATALAGAIVRTTPALRGLATLLVALLATQIGLAATIIWTHRAVTPTTLHLVVGAGILATSVAITLRAARHGRAERPVAALGHAVPA